MELGAGDGLFDFFDVFLVAFEVDGHEGLVGLFEA